MSQANITQPQSGLDEALEETFPASDPTAWTPAKKYHKKFPSLEDQVTIEWKRSGKDFDYETYNRDALLTFGGGKSIHVSNPPTYFGDAKYANSEELFIAALSCCYMQTFLALASKQGYNVKNYVDTAIGVLGNDSSGKMGITEIKLNPTITFEGIQPHESMLQKMQQRAHDNCFIANSVSAKIIINIKLHN